MQTMGFLGPRGTHSEAAALHLAGRLGEPTELKAYPDIFSVIQATADGVVDSCLVPVENSIEGPINISLDTLAHLDDLTIARELRWDVHNQLMGRCAASDVRAIYSHPQPLAQCRKFLMEHFPLAKLVPTASTAKAAELVSSAAAARGGAAAICTARAGELYGLRTIATEIQDTLTNCTRFYQLTRGTAAPLPADAAGRAFLICQLDGKRAGSLYEVLAEFAQRQVNLTRIESRPDGSALGVYIFFLDLEIEPGQDRAPIEEAIAAVRRRSLWLKDMGRFPIMQGM